MFDKVLNTPLLCIILFRQFKNFHQLYKNLKQWQSSWIVLWIVSWIIDTLGNERQRCSQRDLRNDYFSLMLRSSHPEVFLEKGVLKNMLQIYRRTPMPECEVAKQLYWNGTSAWVFSCKFAAYLLNTFSEEQLWRAASGCLSYDSWNL